MTIRYNEGYADRYTNDSNQGLTLVEYNRPGGFMITTSKLDGNAILTKVRFNTAGVADEDVHVFGKKSGSIISVVISGEDPHIISDNERASLAKAEIGEALLFNNPETKQQNFREQYLHHWFNEGVFGRLEFSVPSNCTSMFEADVKNGILTVYVVCSVVENTVEEQWVDMINSRQNRQAKKSTPLQSYVTNREQRRVQNPLYDVFVKKYRL